MKKLCVLLILVISQILFFPDSDSNAKSVSFPIVSKSAPEFIADVGFYKGADGQTQIEFSYSVKLIELSFKLINEKNTAATECNLIVKDADQKIVFQESREKAVAAKTEGEIRDESRGIIDMFVFELPAGKYSLKVSLDDKFSNSVSSMNQTFEVPDLSGSLAVSTPLFALGISSDLTHKLFVKGNRVILPNVSHNFIYHKSILQFYFEAYNFVAPTDSTNNWLNASYLITDIRGDSLLYIPNVVIKKPGTSLAKIEALDIRGFDLGDYELTVELQDPAGNQAVQQKIAFQIVESVATEMELPMSPKDIKRYRDQMKYFATSRELELYDQLDVQGKANFILQFWRSRDETPETSKNEFMLQSFQRIKYAEENFKGDHGGLNSDMGRIFVIYGRPDDIEKYSMNLEGKPYEIWHYYSIKGGNHYFVFIDRNNSGIYTLVHSSILTEIQNPDWKAQELR